MELGADLATVSTSEGRATSELGCRARFDASKSGSRRVSSWRTRCSRSAFSLRSAQKRAALAAMASSVCSKTPAGGFGGSGGSLASRSLRVRWLVCRFVFAGMRTT